MSAPATISSGDVCSSDDLLLRRLLQRRSPSSDVSSSDDLPPPTSPLATISSGFLLVVLYVLPAKSSVSPFCSGSAVQLAISSHSRVQSQFSGYISLVLGRILGLGARFRVYEIITAFYKGNSYIFSANQLCGK
ncbi:uncharacterized protein DS421_12g374090 [Arachis hypogaea]|nr:uncharacterized protein DS421_12g374090 [Arachis hypogaea]